MGKLSFRTIFGGPEMPIEFSQELFSIKNNLKMVDFEYTLDLSLTIGADMVTVTYPTGLRSPRISISTQRVTGSIFINNADTMRPKDHSVFFREVIHDSVSEIFDRMEKKRIEFSKAAHLDKIAFLRTR